LNLPLQHTVDDLKAYQYIYPPKPHTITTYLRRVSVSTITIEGLIEGTILDLGDGTNGMIQSILGTSIVAGNPREEVSQCQVAVVGGKAHGKSSKGDDEIVGI